MNREIKTATRDVMNECISTILLGFSSDPVVRWIFPKTGDYMEYFPQLVKAFGSEAFDKGTVNYTDQFLSVSVWLPPGTHPDEEAIINLLDMSIPEDQKDEKFSVFEQISRYHPEEPHWYLPFIATDPAYQGHGYGSALLKYTISICDEEEKLAYLEATSKESETLYQRYGFEALGTIQQGTSPPIIPMLRSPE